MAGCRASPALASAAAAAAGREHGARGRGVKVVHGRRARKGLRGGCTQPLCRHAAAWGARGCVFPARPHSCATLPPSSHTPARAAPGRRPRARLRAGRGPAPVGCRAAHTYIAQNHKPDTKPQAVHQQHRTCARHSPASGARKLHLLFPYATALAVATPVHCSPAPAPAAAGRAGARDAPAPAQHIAVWLGVTHCRLAAHRVSPLSRQTSDATPPKLPRTCPDHAGPGSGCGSGCGSAACAS